MPASWANLKCSICRPLYWQGTGISPERSQTELSFRERAAGVYSRVLLWVVRRMPNERQRLLVFTIVAGALCGLAAVAFHISVTRLYGLLIDRAAAAPGLASTVWTILTPALGGMIVGLGLSYWIPAAAGSGIPQVKTAYTLRYGAISLKEAVGKFVLCAIQLGSGASLGVEGPTVQICAGVSSWLARVARLSPINSKRMTSVGMAAGIAAAFNAPIAAITFTLEELIGALDQTMLSGVIVAAAIAAVVEHTILGANPIFHVPRLQTYTLTNASSLLWLRAWFRRFNTVPRWLHPALGGAATGFLALVGIKMFHVNGIAGDPYKTLTQSLLGNLPVATMSALCIVKLAATVMSYSSGGSGGIFAPSLFLGGMLGGAVGYLDVTVFHHSADSVGAFAVVGMGAVFAGIVRAPMTSILIIFEMTGGYGLVLPMMIANISAFVLARYWRRTAIYDALLLQDGIDLRRHPASEPPEAPAVKAS